MIPTANENEDNGKGKKQAKTTPYSPDYKGPGTDPVSAPEEGEGLDFGMKSWQENFPNLN